ncbi:MAG: endonuclease/exonuclease/phosphatase family protein [Solirubrobacterales bacterium]
MIRALSWNLYHGRDFPPDRSLRTLRSRILRIEERNETHLQVNRDLFGEFASVLSRAEWDVALLQECPPRWTRLLATACAAEPHVSLTSRNSVSGLRAILAHQNPDLIASGEGGANLTLVRGERIAERGELEMTRRPERRTMAIARLVSGVCVANLHASNAAPSKTGPEVVEAAERAVEWAKGAPLIFGGDFNLRPDRAPGVFEELESRLGLRTPTAPDAIDHLLARGLAGGPAVRWRDERREVREDRLAIRLSDHSPVEAGFEPPPLLDG